MKMFFRIAFIACFLSFFTNSVSASADTDVDFISAASKPPIGVVFEVVEGDEQALEGALKKINEYSKKLKHAIPELKLAIVSHGTEQFALTKKNRTRYKDTHKKVQSLIADSVPVHICGTHASWYNLSKKDFPDYVDVAVAGPAKIREYQRLGYALIKVEID